MLVITVFKWGLSSSSMSSTPRTLIAPKALFKLSVGTNRKLEILRGTKWGENEKFKGMDTVEEHKKCECY